MTLTKTNGHSVINVSKTEVRNFYALPLLLLSMIMLHGCNHLPAVPTTEILQPAQQAYQVAQKNPLVAKYATAELANAEQTLRQAEAAEEPAQQVHLAYLAQRQAQLAIAVAEQKATVADKDQWLQQRNLVQKPEVAKFCEETKVQSLTDLTKTLKGKQTAQGWSFVFEDNQFDTKTELVTAAIHNLNRIISFLKNSPNQKVIIEGQIDGLHNRDHSLGVSQRRADSIRLAMVDCGIASNRLWAKGRSGMVSFANTRTKTVPKTKGRVELIILNAGQEWP